MLASLFTRVSSFESNQPKVALSAGPGTADATEECAPRVLEHHWGVRDILVTLQLKVYFGYTSQLVWLEPLVTVRLAEPDL